MRCDYCEVDIRMSDPPVLLPYHQGQFFLQRDNNGRREYYCSHECARLSIEMIREYASATR